MYSKEKTEKTHLQLKYSANTLFCYKTFREHAIDSNNMD